MKRIDSPTSVCNEWCCVRFVLICKLLLLVIFSWLEPTYSLISRCIAYYCLRYWVIGMFMSSLFVVGHDCGHGTFSNYTWINDIFGHVAHAPLMAPYWPWQKSHRQHHQYTSHIDKDRGHPWITEEYYNTVDFIRRHFHKLPIAGFIKYF